MKIQTTENEITQAFILWESRRRENPETFETEANKLKETPEIYGESAATYFIELLNELKPAKATVSKSSTVSQTGMSD